MIIGILLSALAGFLMSVQGVFNTRVSETIGPWATNLFVQGSAFILTLIIYLFYNKNNFKDIGKVNKFFLLGGIIGVFITFTVMEGIKKLGTTYSISTILISQLVTAAVIDALGLFQTEQIKFSLSKYIGIALMISGIIFFKLKA